MCMCIESHGERLPLHGRALQKSSLVVLHVYVKTWSKLHCFVPETVNEAWHLHRLAASALCSRLSSFIHRTCFTLTTRAKPIRWNNGCFHGECGRQCQV